jgi:pimeloyl-ACP methyl ester carboxylesterase
MEARRGDCVVVVHGLEWIADSMKPVRMELERSGLRVVSYRYPCRAAFDREALVEGLSRVIADGCVDSSRRVHLVAHSLGCIVIRCYLAQHHPANLGRVVFLAPPNHGTQLADMVAQSPMLQTIFGRSVAVLGTKPGSLVRSLPSAESFAPGIIMGGRSAYPLLSAFLPGRDDGIVSVSSGRLEGAGDFIVLPAPHTRIQKVAEVRRQIVVYLRDGKFDRSLLHRQGGPAGGSFPQADR